MRLINARIENYKSIDDTEEFEINQVTCLVGKNEAGKSAILEALYKINPSEPSKQKFEELDYPRRRLVEDKKASPTGIDKVNVLTTTWELEESDYQKLREAIGEDTIRFQQITIQKDYSGNSTWGGIQIDEYKVVKHAVGNCKLTEQQKGELLKAKTWSELISALGALAASHTEVDPVDRIEELKAFQKQATEKFRKQRPILGVIDALTLPTFVYFKEYDRLPGKMSLEAYKDRKTGDRQIFSDKIFEALLDLAGSSAEEIADLKKMESLRISLESVGNHLSDQIFEYWTQNSYLEVQFHFDAAKPEDEAPFNSGHIFSTRIYNKRHRASVEFDQRSTGFIWFFSFLVWFSQVKKHYGDDIIIMLDEPGLALHGRAQEDLIRYINEKLRPHYQVIYTTHSPFMLDMENIFSVRTVQDVVTVDKNGREIVLGTKVGKDLLSRDRDSLLPLEGVLGYDIARSMFVGHHVLVVEGASEIACINWFSRLLASRKRVALDVRWAICPAEGAGKISSFVTLFAGRRLNIVVLMDYHEGQKQMVDKLESSGLLANGHLLRTSDFAGQSEADIEDIIGRELYRHAFQHCLKINASRGIPKNRPSQAPVRLVKEAEQVNALLGLAAAEFNHYMPIEYLMTLPSDQVAALPGLEEALQRFESLFERINSLLSN
jgi:predicted ATPase